MTHLRVPPRLRKWLLAGGVLFASALAAEVIGGAKQDPADASDAEPVLARARPRSQDGPVVASSRAAPDDLEHTIDQVMNRPQGEARVEDLFPQRSWQPPAPTSPPAPPPKPTAPPFPFMVMGSLVNEGQTTVFLSSGDRVVVVNALDTIDGTYQIDSITSDQMTFTYLPLKQKQTIALGGPR